MKNCRAISEVGQGLQVPDCSDIAVCVNADIACELSPPEYRIKAIVTADECTVTPYDYDSDAHLKVRIAVNSFRKLMQLGYAEAKGFVKYGNFSVDVSKETQESTRFLPRGLIERPPD